MWNEVVPEAPLGVSENLFDAGASSLTAVVVTAEIERQFGVHVPFDAFIEAATIEALADVVRATDHGAQSRSSVAITQGGNETPLFCAHPGGTAVWDLRHLARVLIDRPVYGLLPIGLDGATEVPHRVEEMAAQYVQEIDARHPDGPCLLAGFSAGGVVALELGHQLRAGGRAVDSIILFDAYPPQLAWRSTTGSPVIEHGLGIDELLMHNALSDAWDYCPTIRDIRSRYLEKRVRDDLSMLEFLEEVRPFFASVLAELKEHGFAAPGVQASEFWRQREIWMKYLWASITYDPRARDHRGGRTVLIATEASRVIGAIRTWRETIPSIIVHQVSCSHVDLLCDAGVLDIAATELARPAPAAHTRDSA
jgi:thioesterase domain-containing protein/aryl carrier-like protein